MTNNLPQIKLTQAQDILVLWLLNTLASCAVTAFVACYQLFVSHGLDWPVLGACLLSTFATAFILALKAYVPAHITELMQAGKDTMQELQDAVASLTQQVQAQNTTVTHVAQQVQTQSDTVAQVAQTVQQVATHTQAQAESTATVAQAAVEAVQHVQSVTATPAPQSVPVSAPAPSPMIASPLVVINHAASTAPSPVSTVDASTYVPPQIVPVPVLPDVTPALNSSQNAVEASAVVNTDNAISSGVQGVSAASQAQAVSEDTAPLAAVKAAQQQAQ